MNNPQLPAGQWRKQKGRLMLMFPHLVDQDFTYEYGMKAAMMTKLQEKLGKSSSELNELISPYQMKKSGFKSHR